MYTLSWHQEGELNTNQAHNRREPHAVGKDSTVDLSLSKNNIIFRDIPLREAYHKLFDDAVNEYNNRTREERQIDDYYSHLAKTKTGKRNKGKQRVYEAIVQLGSKSEGHPEKALEAYKAYINDWDRRNPNMVMIGAYYHQDEPEGTPHLHIDYIPVAECNRGMKLQNSLTRALAAQGFKTGNKENKQFTAQQQWEQAERDCMREICKNLGIELHKQGIGRKRHLTVKEYKDCQDQIKQAKAELTMIETDKIFANIDKQTLLNDIKNQEKTKQKYSTELNNLQNQIQYKQAELNYIDNEFINATDELNEAKQELLDYPRNNQRITNIYNASNEIDNAMNNLYALLTTDEQRQALENIYNALDNAYELYQDNQYIDDEEMEL